MPLTDPYQGWQTPAGNELPDGAAAFAALRDKAVNQSALRFATVAARDAAIPTANRLAGMLAHIASHGGYTCVRANSGSWTPLQEATFEPSGSTIAGITRPVGLQAAVDRLQIKTGQHTFFTSTAFGNEYAPGVTFSTAFPNFALFLGVTQIEVSADSTFAATKVAIDTLSATDFRVMYPGGASTTKRSYLWMAMGY